MGLVIDLLKGALMHEHLWTDILPYGIFPSALTINGDLTVNGNLIQSNSISVSDVLIDDNIILLNNGETGAGVTLIESGINIDRGTLNDAYLTFNETDDLWHYGFIGGIDTIINTNIIEKINLFITGQSGIIATGLLETETRIPYTGTIIGWTLFGSPTGNIVIDTWKDTYANYPPTVTNTIWEGSKPTLISTVKNTVTGLTIPVVAGDILRYNIDSCTLTTSCNLIIYIQRT